MMVWYVIKLRKQLVYFNWISTASLVALNGNTKLMQHRFMKSLVLQLDQIGHSEKKLQRSSPLSISSKRLVLKTTNVIVIMTLPSQKQYCFCCVGMLNWKGFHV